jgi:hypothetical protein
MLLHVRVQYHWFRAIDIDNHAHVQATRVEALAAKNAIELAKLEAQLLEREKEAMQDELKQVQPLPTGKCMLSCVTNLHASHLHAPHSYTYSGARSMSCESVAESWSTMQNAERLESGKAAVIASVGGLVGVLPTSLTSTEGVSSVFLTAGAAVATCALFGVVYRYVLATDKTNPHLKGGAVAAFGLTRGFPLATGVLGDFDSPTVEALASAALLTGQSVLMIAFAATALEFALTNDALKHFGESES